MVEREYKEYVITRNWKYINQKLEETYTVLEEGKQLANQELSYFQNYLQGLIPPDLFEFFLFDGEEVGNIFSSNSYNTYIKNAIYTLCGIDIFEIIRKFTSGYSSRANGEADDELYDQYAITVTMKSKQYQDTISRYLKKNGVNEADSHAKSIINMFNALMVIGFLECCHINLIFRLKN